MKSIILAYCLFLLILNSCKTESSVMHFQSIDEYTGGFQEYNLDLDSNGVLSIKLVCFRLDSISEKGNEWVSITKNYTGKWYMKNNNIRLLINDSKDSNNLIGNISNYSFLKMKPIVHFSKHNDTAYIYGLPCIFVKK